jgi:cobalt-zinc-cadmium efflux system outer membrane protein
VWNRNVTVTVQLAAAFVLLAGPLTAQVSGQPTDTMYLELSEARRLALERNPSFLAEAQRLDAARGVVRAAGALRFNPEAEAELPGTLRGEGPRDYEIVVSQTVEWAGQRGLRMDAAEAGLERAVSIVADARRRTTSQVTVAYYRALAADRRRAVATDLFELNERLLQAVEIQIREGEISVMDANFAEIEGARSLARVLAARREAIAAELELGRLLGAPPNTHIRVADSSDRQLPSASRMRLEDLLVASENRRPDLESRAHYVREAQSLARLAGREALPNLGVGALLSGTESSSGPRIGLQLSLPIPLWNRNQGLVDERRADLRRVTLELEAIELTIRAEVTEAFQDYALAGEEESLLSERVLGPARSNQALLETAYREGEIDLPSLVLLRNQLLDAELGYWDAWLAKRQSYTRLETAIGSFDLDLTDPDLR